MVCTMHELWHIWNQNRGRYKDCGVKPMTINPRDIHIATDGKIYSFSGFGGFMNCSICDNDTAVNEYDRQDDGAVMWFCKPCEDRLHL